MLVAGCGVFLAGGISQGWCRWSRAWEIPDGQEHGPRVCGEGQPDVGPKLQISLPLQFVSQQSFSETKEESFESFGFQVCIHISTYTLSMHSISFLNPWLFFFFFLRKVPLQIFCHHRSLARCDPGMVGLVLGSLLKNHKHLPFLLGMKHRFLEMRTESQIFSVFRLVVHMQCLFCLKCIFWTLQMYIYTHVF